MVHSSSFAQAASAFLAFLAVASAYPTAESAGMQKLEAMLSGDQPIELLPGNPWDGGAEDLMADYEPSHRQLNARADCVRDVPSGQGPAVLLPDTPEAFKAYVPFGVNALLFNLPLLTTFIPVTANAKAALEVTPTSKLGYQGWYNMPSYTPSTCATMCKSITDCDSFNIFYLRSPTIAPAALCPNPISMTNIVCSFFSGKGTLGSVINEGQNLTNFQVVMAGSNIYTDIL